MPLFPDKDGLYRAIQSNLSGWKFTSNPNGYYLWETPSKETIVITFVNTNFNTTANRAKPQLRIYADKAYSGMLYAKQNNYRFFFFAYCTKSPGMLKFSSAGDPSIYLVSIEDPLSSARDKRLDIRSMYDQLETSYGQGFFRVTVDMHSCPSLRQSAFIRLSDQSGAFSTAILEQYLLYFDSRPYMADAQRGPRTVHIPSVLFQPTDLEPLALPWNLLIHGAPGTGKSFFLNQKVDEFKKNGPVEMRRVTFYEDYSYGQFVGEYMPVLKEDAAETVDIQCPSGPIMGNVTGEHITYRFLPGPFAEMLAECFAAKLNGKETKFVLIVEELNRANAASVLGDMFQLLDREKGVSIYEITPRADLVQYLYEAVSMRLEDGAIHLDEGAFSKLRLPDNFYLWATMNGADQGVFPLDSAFKRRWSYIYRDIYEVDPTSALRPWICLPLLDDLSGQLSAAQVSWDPVRTAINEKILAAGFAEDRCLGYWFFSEEELCAIETYTKAAVDHKNGIGQFDLTALSNPLVDKLFAYLIQDVFRNVPTSVFSNGINGLSQIRRALKQLEIDGNTIGIQSILQLPMSTYVTAPSTETVEI